MSAVSSQDSRIPHVLNYGMGVDSTAILLRWLNMTSEERGFDLEDLIVLTAQTGDEFIDTKHLVETYVFPLLWQHRIRFVEVAKHGPYERDGYTLLQDTREPYALHIEGDFKLSTHMHERGTVPSFSGPHLCAMKWKGFVIDRWLSDYLDGVKFGPYLGYSAEETKRAEKCGDYHPQGNEYRFPLIEWGWTRQMCLDYIWGQLGVKWLKSCCTFCPFQSRENAIARWQANPEAAAFALFTEALSLATNPRMHLFSSGSAYDLVVNSGNQTALDLFEQMLNANQWGLYRVERIYERNIGQKGKPYTRVARRVVKKNTGNREDMIAALTCKATDSEPMEQTVSCARVYSHRRVEGVFPAIEGFWVACPALVEDKVRNAKSFAQKWAAFTGAEKQLSLI
ncbi:MAG: hypothetical protein F6J97_20710 [Leptolyngbya sp. SIO4C1]|nr:hypothetical protein [Leptolyngbya sp. SIO4C1]